MRLKCLSYSKGMRMKGIILFYKSSIFFSTRQMKLVLPWKSLFFLFFFFLLIKGIIMENVMRDREIFFFLLIWLLYCSKLILVKMDI